MQAAPVAQPAPRQGLPAARRSACHGVPGRAGHVDPRHRHPAAARGRRRAAAGGAAVARRGRGRPAHGSQLDAGSGDQRADPGAGRALHPAGRAGAAGTAAARRLSTRSRLRRCVTRSRGCRPRSPRPPPRRTPPVVPDGVASWGLRPTRRRARSRRHGRIRRPSSPSWRRSRRRRRPSWPRCRRPCCDARCRTRAEPRTAPLPRGSVAARARWAGDPGCRTVVRHRRPGRERRRGPRAAGRAQRRRRGGGPPRPPPLTTSCRRSRWTTRAGCWCGRRRTSDPAGAAATAATAR